MPFSSVKVMHAEMILILKGRQFKILTRGFIYFSRNFLLKLSVFLICLSLSGVLTGFIYIDRGVFLRSCFLMCVFRRVWEPEWLSICFFKGIKSFHYFCDILFVFFIVLRWFQKYYEEQRFWGGIWDYF